jgi:hypothetical protein
MGLARRHAPPRRRRLWSVLTRKPYKKGAAKIDIYYAERGYYMRQCSLLHLPCLLMTRLRIFWLPTRAASPSPGAADGHRRDNSALVRESCCECAFRCSPPRAFRARPAVAVTEKQRPLRVIASGAKRSSLHACLHARSVSIARAPPTQCELLNAAAGRVVLTTALGRCSLALCPCLGWRALQSNLTRGGPPCRCAAEAVLSTAWLEVDGPSK